MKIETAEELVVPIMEAVDRAGRLKFSVFDHDTHFEEIAAIIAADRKEAVAEFVREVTSALVNARCMSEAEEMTMLQATDIIRLLAREKGIDL